MSYDANNQVDRSPCSCCSGGSKEKIVLCNVCVHPERFRVYCMNCSLRMDMSFNEAQEFFEKTDARELRTVKRKKARHVLVATLETGMAKKKQKAFRWKCRCR